MPEPGREGKPRNLIFPVLRQNISHAFTKQWAPKTPVCKIREKMRVYILFQGYLPFPDFQRNQYSPFRE